MLLSPLLVVCIRLYAIILDPFFEGNMFCCCCFFGRRKCVSLSLPEASCLGEALQTSLFNNKTKPARGILNHPDMCVCVCVCVCVWNWPSGHRGLVAQCLLLLANVRSPFLIGDKTSWQPWNTVKAIRRGVQKELLLPSSHMSPLLQKLPALALTDGTAYHFAEWWYFVRFLFCSALSFLCCVRDYFRNINRYCVRYTRATSGYTWNRDRQRRDTRSWLVSVRPVLEGVWARRQ